MKNIQQYTAPTIDLTELDNSISLALESSPSDPPFGPGETSNLRTPDFFNNDPFRIDVG